jgi:head-tail adaptor
MSATAELFSGELRERITFEEPLVIGRTSSGGEQIQWTPRGTFWAKVEELQGSELHSAQQIDGDITTRFIIRRQDIAIPETWRAVWTKFGATTYYDIQPPTALVADRSLFEIMAIRRPAERNT